MKKVLLYLWQLPQNVVGLCFILWGYLSSRTVWMEDYRGIRYYAIDGMSGAISLGDYVILQAEWWEREEAITLWRHEWGHTRQSRKLGWLYLPVVGLPSLLWATYYKLARKHTGYYRFWTERWANELAGLNF